MWSSLALRRHPSLPRKVLTYLPSQAGREAAAQAGAVISQVASEEAGRHYGASRQAGGTSPSLTD